MVPHRSIARRRHWAAALGQRARRQSPPGTATTWCCGRSTRRRPMRWRAIAPARARVAGLPPARRGRGVERHRRRGARDATCWCVAVPSRVVAATCARRAPRRPRRGPRRWWSTRRRASRRHRRDDGRGDRGEPAAAIAARGVPVRAELRRRDGARAAGGAGRARRHDGDARARPCRRCFGGDRFRIYTTDDVIGVVWAARSRTSSPSPPACSDGLGFGHNARAALITRGLAEIGPARRCAWAATRSRSRGSPGMGDLVLTCTGELSRNRQVGAGAGARRRAGRHPRRASARSPRASAPPASRASWRRSSGVDMPITREVAAVLHDGKPPRAAVERSARARHRRGTLIADRNRLKSRVRETGSRNPIT